MGNTLSGPERPKEKHLKSKRENKKSPPPRQNAQQGLDINIKLKYNRAQHQAKIYSQEWQDHMRALSHQLMQEQHLGPLKDQHNYKNPLRGQQHQQGQPHRHVPQINNQQRGQSRVNEINSKLRQKADELQSQQGINKELQNENATHLKTIQLLLKDMENKDSKIRDLERNLKLYKDNLYNKRWEPSPTEFQTGSDAAPEETDDLLNSSPDNSPNITDLSDENRPTKIAERFGELFDNQWTDAFSEIGGENDEQIATTLLNAPKVMYKECDEKAKSQLRDVETAIQKISGSDDLPELIQSMKHRRKGMVKQHIKELEPVIQHRLTAITNMESKDMKPLFEVFLRYSLKLCWLMVIQDPPVFMDCNTKSDNQPLDKNKYKPYTVRGNTVSFIVWPALYLHENGPILSKGIAQCKYTILIRNPDGTKRKPNLFERKYKTKSKHTTVIQAATLSSSLQEKRNFNESTRM